MLLLAENRVSCTKWYQNLCFYLHSRRYVPFTSTSMHYSSSSGKKSFNLSNHDPFSSSDPKASSSNGFSSDKNGDSSCVVDDGTSWPSGEGAGIGAPTSGIGVGTTTGPPPVGTPRGTGNIELHAMVSQNHTKDGQISNHTRPRNVARSNQSRSRRRMPTTQPSRRRPDCERVAQARPSEQRTGQCR